MHMRMEVICARNVSINLVPSWIDLKTPVSAYYYLKVGSWGIG